jgi:hypothetical protein
LARVDLAVRNHVYADFVATGRAPTAPDVARALGMSESEAADALRRLHDAHALVLDRHDPPRIAMLNPFACRPTPHRVRARGRWWYANCGWDAFGVAAALDADAEIASSCPDCAEPIEIQVRAQRAVPDDHVFHVLLPASRWWDDIAFT